MKTYPPKEANCDLCDRAFSDENLIVLLTIYDDPPRFTGVMAPALAYVACGPCHTAHHHPNGDGDEVCGTLREYRDGTMIQWWSWEFFYKPREIGVEDGQAWLDTAYDWERMMMDEIAKTCPECGPATRLVLRTNKATNQKFLGCPSWPRCEYTEPLPLDQELRLSGAAELPGLGQ